MNKNTRRKVEAARDAFGRLKHGHHVQPGDDILAQRIGRKPSRNHGKSKVGASDKDIARHLGHHLA